MMENIKSGQQRHGSPRANSYYYYSIYFLPNCTCVFFFTASRKFPQCYRMAHCQYIMAFTSVLAGIHISVFSFFLPFFQSVVIRFTHTLVVFFFFPRFTPFRSEIRNNEIFFSSLPSFVSPLFFPLSQGGKCRFQNRKWLSLMKTCSGRCDRDQQSKIEPVEQ